MMLLKEKFLKLEKKTFDILSHISSIRMSNKALRQKPESTLKYYGPSCIYTSKLFKHF